ncbi:MAG: DUF1028 domain-containing protein [Bacteroidetes bacterium]|nr:DUF1028 domain-containing protein [Bacteroidota bacterium]
MDTVTGEVGSAGASCIDDIGCGGCGGVVIISGIIPGKGAVNAQASVCIPNYNLQNALGWMQQGFSPQAILDSLQANDACAWYDWSRRQYGIVDLYNGSARSAGYTGINCLDYKNHITGSNYSIQGNILLGQEILDSMEARFLNSNGDLACKLMAALQGAKVPGADTRCLSSGNSSLSSYLRVARSTDTASSFYLDIVIKSGPYGYEPIDSLQELFDSMHSCTASSIEKIKGTSPVNLLRNPSVGTLSVVVSRQGNSLYRLETYDNLGRRISVHEFRKSVTWEINAISPGNYYYTITDVQENKTIKTGILHIE